MRLGKYQAHWLGARFSQWRFDYTKATGLASQFRRWSCQIGPLYIYERAD